MNRILSIAVVFLVTASAFATDRFSRDPEQMSIATTGRIVKIDAKNKTMKVRGSEGPTTRNAAPTELRESLWQRIGVKMPNMRMPGGISISLPGRTTKVPTAKPTPDGTTNLTEYTVVTNSDTVFQDGIDSLRFEDFKSGETISIHGSLSGSTLTASRVAKWD
jgi:hypothetical protein